MFLCVACCRSKLLTNWPFTTLIGKQLKFFPAGKNAARMSDTVKERLAKMPKEEQRFITSPFQPGGVHRNFLDKNRPASEIYFQVLGNGSGSSTRSLFVFTDQYRCLFNCGEGTQRLANEYKAKISRLDHVFVTHRCWENVGGLPGLILTLQGVGVPKIALHGPPDIEKLFHMTKSFMLTNDIRIEKKNLDAGSYHDNVMSVEYVPLYGAPLVVDKEWHETNEVESEDYYGDQRPQKRAARVIVDSDDQLEEKRLRISPKSKNYDVSVAYICRPTNKPGQLQLEKCLEYGVQPGPLLGQLKNGNDVTLPNGKIVKSSDVVSPDVPGPYFIVIECPTVDFLDSLLESEPLRAHQDKATTPLDEAAVVVHFTPCGVLEHPKYREWMTRFPASTDHLFINRNNVGPTSFAIHRLQHKLHLLHSDIFPLLKGDLPSDDASQGSNGGKCGYSHCETMLKYYLRPLKKTDRSSLVKVVPEEFKREAARVPSFQQVLLDLRLNLKENTSNDGKYPEIVFLGTGSSIPNKVRNTSGILFNLSDEKSILMDCGEGTFGQLYRIYGRNGIGEVLRRIFAVYVSHLHADHHLGLVQLLKERRRAFSGMDSEFFPLWLLAPKQILFWLKAYHNVFEPVLDEFKLIPNTELFMKSDKISSLQYMELLADLDLKQLDTVYVKHCLHSFGVALRLKSGWKMVYSGDTMPCDTLVDIGKGCDLLIHEATMEDELKETAVEKRHSCTSEAINMGLKMNAKFIILTHFSQRYAKVPLYNDNFSSQVGIAFDNMKLSVRDLHILPKFKEALQTLFADEYDYMYEKTAKKKRRMELVNEMTLKVVNEGR